MSKQQQVKAISDHYKDKFEREELSVIMEKMGIKSSSGGLMDGHDDLSCFGADQLLALFEEEEPSWEEVREAFEVFDQNRDGFIDASELQRVVLGLGLELGIEECGRMISVFDEDGDGLVSFGEFVKVMWTCFPQDQ